MATDSLFLRIVSATPRFVSLGSLVGIVIGILSQWALPVQAVCPGGCNSNGRRVISGSEIQSITLNRVPPTSCVCQSWVGNLGYTFTRSIQQYCTVCNQNQAVLTETGVPTAANGMATGIYWVAGGVCETTTGTSGCVQFLPLEYGWVSVSVTIGCQYWVVGGGNVDPTVYVYRQQFWELINECDCSSGTCYPLGSGSSSLSSIDTRISLGQTAFGQKPLGHLLIQAKDPSPLMATPAGLALATRRQYARAGQLNPPVRSPALTADLEPPEEVVLIGDEAEQIRQVKVPQGLVDIITLSPQQYEIRFYTVAGSQSGGLFQAIGDPISVWTIENPDPSGATFDRLRLSHTAQGRAEQTEYQWDAAQACWRLIQNGGARQEVLRKWGSTQDPQRLEVRELFDKDQRRIQRKQTLFERVASGERVIQEVLDPEGAARGQSHVFGPNGLLQRTIKSDGTWKFSEYDDWDRLIRCYSGFLNEGPTTEISRCRVTEYSYAPVADDGSERPNSPRLVVEKVLGHEIRRTYYAYRPGEKTEIQCQTPGARWNAPDNLVTVTRTFTSGPFIDEPRSVLHPDGTMDLYTYSIDPTGQYRTDTVQTGQPDASGQRIIDGTQTVTVIAYTGEILSKTVTDIASGLGIDREVYSDFDSARRSRRVDYLDGTHTEKSYDCCGLASETDREGNQTSYAYDEFKRPFMTTRQGITFIKELDALGKVLSEVRQGTDGSQIRLRQHEYNEKGELIATTDAAKHTTQFHQETDAQGQTIKSTTCPDGGTRVETLARDGTLLSVTGTAVAPVRYVHGVEMDEGYARSYTQTIKLDANGQDTLEWTKDYKDLLGRGYKTVYADGAASRSWYNQVGQLWKTRDPDGVVRLLEYNRRGQVEYSALDMNRNDQIDLGGIDRITRTAQDVTTRGEYIVRRSRNWVWAEENKKEPTLVATQEQAVNGLVSWQQTHGLSHITQTRLEGQGAKVVEQTAPDESQTISRYEGGRLVSQVRLDAKGQQLMATSFGYDAHGRRHTVTDARNGTTTYEYNDLDRVVSLTTPQPDDNQPSQTTRTEYDAMGRPLRIIHPDQAVVYREYYPNGKLKTEHGARTYPVEYTYDAQGRMKTLTTWQDFKNDQGRAVTTWYYDAQRGFMRSKRYDDNKGPDYTYTPAGRLQTRTWARGIVTTYDYTPAGELKSITYSDGNTPNVAYGYNRLGQAIMIRQGDWLTTRAYNNAGQMLSEAYTGGPLDTLKVVNRYDEFNRRTELSAVARTTDRKGNAIQSETIYKVAYGYDAASRLQTVAEGENRATYQYLANSGLVEQVDFENQDQLRIRTRKEYDHLNRLRTIASRNAQGQVIDSYTYDYNAANQRERVLEVDGSRWEYGYDALGQVTVGQKYGADGQQMSDRQYRYDYDDIGNRHESVANGNTTRYQANRLNQYSQVDQHIWQYDADGNLLTDGEWQYTWDAENRLIGMRNRSKESPEGGKRLEFAHDHQGRRILKAAEERDMGTDQGSFETRRFIYDGWNLVAELDSHAQLLSAHVWGLDLSGSLQGAGGVGGLLWSIPTTSDPFTGVVVYDGNGNVQGLLDIRLGTWLSRYEYSPYGEVLHAIGLMPIGLPFQFSTKYRDDTTAMQYYGFRYYNPLQGRWPSRDPIYESGGYNLYSSHNNGCNVYDVLGLTVSFESEGRVYRDNKWKLYFTSTGDESAIKPSLNSWFWQEVWANVTCTGGICNSGGTDIHVSSFVKGYIKNNGPCTTRVRLNCTFTYYAWIISMAPHGNMGINLSGTFLGMTHQHTALTPFINTSGNREISAFWMFNNTNDYIVKKGVELQVYNLYSHVEEANYVLDSYGVLRYWPGGFSESMAVDCNATVLY